jgi:ABC-type sugar transport system ATPase subunit
MQPDGTAVALDRLSKTFANGVVALRDVSLEVQPGEWLVMVGPSAGGKTTLLRLIAGLDHPTSGSIRLNNLLANDLPPWRRGVAMAFQRPALAPSRTVRDNLALGRRQTGGLSPDQLAGMLSLTDVLERHPHQLSGGQQQRAALGRALGREAPLCLLDEPLGHLDAPLREQLRRDLHLLHKQLRATIMSVTHDPAEAWALGDRVAVLRQGSIRQVAEPERLYREPCDRFVAEFCARGPMNIFQGQVQRQQDCIQWRTSDWRAVLPWREAVPSDADAILGLRAEDVQVAAARSEQGDCRPMRVVSVERQPGGAWVTGEVEGRSLTGWMTGAGELQMGHMVFATMNWNQAFLFERATGRTLRAACG